MKPLASNTRGWRWGSLRRALPEAPIWAKATNRKPALAHLHRWLIWGQRLGNVGIPVEVLAPTGVNIFPSCLFFVHKVLSLPSDVQTSPHI